jgi:RNA polymerase sigma factor (sigma-70 family)
MRDLTDLEIIASVKRGNQADYAIIIDRYKNKAFSLIKRMLKNEMAAEEVLQDCFLKTYYALSSFREESKFSTWFYRIVYNTTLNKASSRKGKIEDEMSSLEDHFNLESNYDFRDTENSDLSSFVRKMLEKLPPNYSSVLSMFYLNEMSCEEISEVMNISIPNVKVILHRSRNALRNLIIKNDLIREIS